MTFARSVLPRMAAAVLLCLVACGDDDTTEKPERDAGDVRDASDSAGKGDPSAGAGSSGKSGTGGSSGSSGSGDIDASMDASMDASECGNGIAEALEDCDDGNHANGDGCTAECIYETGWSCSTDQPTTCQPGCGDGKRVGAETAADRCDDHGIATGDGCDAQCHVEASWSCSGEPSVCSKLCGNGALDNGEACDDGNSVAADGCSACGVDSRWQCSGSPSVCTAELDANLLRTGSQLAAFSTLDPAKVQTPVQVTGLVVGDQLVAIDRRPNNGMLYGLGYNASAGTAQLYMISSETGLSFALGAATKFAGSDGSTPVSVSGTQFGMDFNPVADRVRIVNNQGQNFRINPNTGGFIDGDSTPTGIQPDMAINGATSSLDECAYTNNAFDAAVTTLYTVDHVTGKLYIQKPTNNGAQTTAQTIVPATIYVAGFDIPAGIDAQTSDTAVSGTGFVALRLMGASQDSFAKINLATGAVSGAVDIGTNSVGMALQNTQSLPVYALTTDGLHVWRFKSTNPNAATMITVGVITAGEVLVDIEFRPASGELIALGINATANTGSLYLLDPLSGTATVIGSASQIALVDAGAAPVDLPAASEGWAIDFNPAPDRIRVVTATGLNFRINPATGGVSDGDPGATGVNPDTAISGLAAGSTGLSGAAYTNSYGGATVTTLYLLDASANSLCVSTNPNGGSVANCVPITSGAQPLDVTAASEIDIPADVRVGTANAVATGLAYAVVTVAGKGHLFTIDLATGMATDLGQIGSGPQFSGLTVGHANVK
jgi:cysteine-rich repeat protein